MTRFAHKLALFGLLAALFTFGNAPLHARAQTYPVPPDTLNTQLVRYEQATRLLRASIAAKTPSVALAALPAPANVYTARIPRLESLITAEAASLASLSPTVAVVIPSAENPTPAVSYVARRLSRLSVAIVNLQASYNSLVVVNTGGGGTVTATSVDWTLRAVVNLCHAPFWNTSTSTGSQVLTWDKFPAAVEYNVYASETYKATLSAPSGNAATVSYTMPSDMYRPDRQYTITAVSSDGKETRPSAPSEGLIVANPANFPVFLSKAVPTTTPGYVTAIPDWNDYLGVSGEGHARVVVQWLTVSGVSEFTDSAVVFRDGTEIARGLWGFTYIDDAPLAGTHSYTVAWSHAYATAPWKTDGDVRTGPQSAGATATTLTGPAAPVASPTILSLTPNDDSVLVTFSMPSFGKDAYLYDITHPGKVKYAAPRPKSNGQNTGSPPVWSIEWNGVDPTNGSDLRLVIVDKAGPFQRTHGAQNPNGSPLTPPANVGAGGTGAALQTAAGIESSLNGQGDPSNVPYALASTGQFHVVASPFSYRPADYPSNTWPAETQQFVDLFRAEPLFTQQSIVTAASGVGLEFYRPNTYRLYNNGIFDLQCYGEDPFMRPTFSVSKHQHTDLADGGSLDTSLPNHNNNASLVLTPRNAGNTAQRVFDFSGGKCLHASFEVDPHMKGARAWVDFYVTPDEQLLNPGKNAVNGLNFWWPNLSGRAIRWEIQGGSHMLFLTDPTSGQNPDGPLRQIDLLQLADFADTATVTRDGGPMQGTSQDLDRRHRFDFYLTTNHYRLEERAANGTLLMRRDKAFPVGYTLPYTSVRIGFTSQAYHTAEGRDEIIAYGHGSDPVFVNYAPFDDTRHWDSLSCQVLASLPAVPN